MSKILRVLTVAIVFAFAAGPAWAAPMLSAHSATVSAPAHQAPGHPWLQTLPFALAPIAGLTIKKDAGTIATKFVQRASAATQDYQAGVQNAAGAWQANAAAAEPAYEQGVQQAISKKRYGSGINGTSAAKFTKNATSVGPQRYGTGVQAAQSAYQTGVQPYLDVLKGVDLPARGPKGSPQNMQRAQAVAAALRAKKVGS
ncbi:MAG: hypothetical protein ACRD1V_02055 [Vicinamibacterales bacterium]